MLYLLSFLLLKWGTASFRIRVCKLQKARKLQKITGDCGGECLSGFYADNNAISCRMMEKC